MKSMHLVRVLLMILVLVLAACGGGKVSVSTANIGDVTLSSDKAGTQATTAFEPADIFYLIVNLRNAPDSTTVKAVWTAVAVVDAAANTLIDEAELTSGSATLTFDLSNTNPWPAGDYKVDLYLDGKLDRTLTFNVRGPAATPTPVVAAATATPAPSATPSGLVGNLTAVKSAVVQIEAQGTFRDPEVGMLYNTAGRGSGFIIDPSGIAVTNNHVVTGAALLRVWVGGETSPRNARVLGVSECADLAVIDISGDGYPYLAWYDGPVEVGLDVYAAGFPLGDPEFTLTRGIIAKARASGETSWASVDGVVQHDATINPGNSGGPLVTTGGRVVAVNYAGDEGVSQYFAITGEQALPLIAQLRDGESPLSIGVNGYAINDDEGLSGIWVASVKSGSPADVAGVKTGDIITQLEGLVLATDGTMSDYCDVLRSHHPEDTLNIEVLRFDTSEVLAGQLNGRPLAQSFSFASEVVEEAGAEAAAPGSAAGYTYVTINDDSGLLEMLVPDVWGDIDGSEWILDDEPIGLSLTASPDIAAFLDTWDAPGVFFGATDQVSLTVEEVLDEFDYSDECVYSDRTPYDDGVYTGFYDFWSDCGTSGTLLLTLAVRPADEGYLAFVLVQMLTEDDVDAADQILASFIVNE